MPPPPDAASKRRLALIVASSEYRDPTLQRLRSPGRDAEALAEVLGDPAIGAFDVRTLLNLPSHELFRGIAEYCADARPSDLLLLYFSCHGVLDDHGRLHYATVNTERRLLAATSVSAHWLNDQLEDCRARQQLLVLDCCHSGAFAKGMKGEGSLALKDRFDSRGRVVLTASRATEYSFEGDQVHGEGVSSVFTAALVQGLRTGDADRDKDGLITATELYDYVHERTTAVEARQNPAFWTYGAEGNVLVARSPRGAVIALPEDLHAILDSPRPRIRESAVAELADLLDRAEPGLALTARERLTRVSEDDLPRVAALARAALEAQPGHAAEQVHSELEERDRHLAEERARRDAEERARRDAEERARRDAEEKARREAKERARPKAEQRARWAAEEERVQSGSRRAHTLSRRRAVIIAATLGVAGVVLLVAYLSWARPPEATVLDHLPDALRPSCNATADESANCRLTDGTVVFFRLFGTTSEAHSAVVDGNDVPEGTPCPPSPPAAGTSVVCRYTMGAETGVAMFGYTVKDTHRFYLSRWNPDTEPLLRGEMSTRYGSPQDWDALTANWSLLVGM
jgi:Caspase domain